MVLTKSALYRKTHGHMSYIPCEVAVILCLEFHGMQTGAQARTVSMENLNVWIQFVS